jgi:hypothetical protein
MFSTKHATTTKYNKNTAEKTLKYSNTPHHKLMNVTEKKREGENVKTHHNKL